MHRRQKLFFVALIFSYIYLYIYIYNQSLRIEYYKTFLNMWLFIKKISRFCFVVISYFIWILNLRRKHKFVMRLFKSTRVVGSLLRLLYLANLVHTCIYVWLFQLEHQPYLADLRMCSFSIPLLIILLSVIFYHETIYYWYNYYVCVISLNIIVIKFTHLTTFYIKSCLCVLLMLF